MSNVALSAPEGREIDLAPLSCRTSLTASILALELYENGFEISSFRSVDWNISVDAKCTKYTKHQGWSREIESSKSPCAAGRKQEIGSVGKRRENIKGNVKGRAAIKCRMLCMEIGDASRGRIFGEHRRGGFMQRDPTSC